jgi:hypothetical protein
MEARFAEWCDSVKTEWEYEPETLMLSNGVQYTPDFILPTCNTIVEVKPAIFLKETQRKMDALASAEELFGFRLVVLEMRHKSAWGAKKEWPCKIKTPAHVPRVLKCCMRETECEPPDNRIEGPLRSFTDRPDEMCCFFCSACRAPNVTNIERWVIDIRETYGRPSDIFDTRCSECGHPMVALSMQSQDQDWLWGRPPWPEPIGDINWDQWNSIGKDCKRALTP